MSGKKVILGLAFLGVLFAAVLWGAKHFLIPAPKICQVCQRAIHEGQEFTISLQDGSQVAACCPRCGLHFETARGKSVSGTQATDFVKGDRLPAKDAVFVETTQVSYCAEHQHHVERSQQTLSDLQWDRCWPTLVAFRNRSEAAEFQRLNGGRVLSYDEAVASVKQR